MQKQIKKCKWCEKEFEISRPASLYCCDECKIKGRKLSRRKYNVKMWNLVSKKRNAHKIKEHKKD